MGKGKGHQAGAFASKAMNRQFQLEWHEQLPSSRKRRSAKKPDQARERPKIQWHSLQGLLQQREYDDRLEYRAMRQKKSVTNHPNKQQNPPGWVVYYGADDPRTDYTSGAIPSLQSLALQALAPALQDYIDAWGSELVQYHLSLLPSDTLTDLSVLVSSKIGMTNEICKVLGPHDHVKALCLVAPQTDDEDDSRWKALTDDAILEIIPQWGIQRETIPNSWEEDTTTFDGAWKGCVKLQRLELGHVPHLSVETLSALLRKCGGITHLGIVGSLGYNSGPEILWKMHDLLPKLQVLDLSHTPWLTEELVRGIFKAYGGVLTIKAVGSLPLTDQVSLENDYPNHFWRAPRKEANDSSEALTCWAALY